MEYLPLRTILWIEEQFEKELSQYYVQEYKINEFEKVLLVNDSLALFVEISEHRVTAILDASDKERFEKNAYCDVIEYGGIYYSLDIEEVTYNELGFKHNHTQFVNRICKSIGVSFINYKLPGVEGTWISYKKFRGYTRLYWCLDTPTVAEYVNDVLPELRLRERYETWVGVHYYFVIIECENKNGEIHRAVAYTTKKPHAYIISFGNDYIKQGGFGELRAEHGFYEALTSWKGVRRQKRLEEHLKYFFVEKNFREKDDVWRYADEVLKQANNGKFVNAERSTYLKPVYKWINEELVLRITKKIYKDYKVIHQYRPFFLKSSFGGQMSYDIFINGLNVAIEYQGKQHFEPIDYFGGEEAFEKNRQRDAEKKRLSERYGVKLVYINFDEEITPELIRKRVEE